MTLTTVHSSELSLSPPKMQLFRVLRGFLTAGIRDMNRYMDAVTLVQPANPQDPRTKREQP